MSPPRTSRRIGLRGFILTGLVIALIIGMGFSYLAASTPDALQRAVIEAECAGAAEPQTCLAEAEGEPLLRFQPGFLFDYGTPWVSGLVGVVVAFALGTGIMLLVRRLGGGSSADGDRVR